MRVCAVGFANDSGMGRELISAARQLPFLGVYVLEHASKATRIDLLPSSSYTVARANTVADMNAFLDRYRPSTILTWEGPGYVEFPRLWSSKGIRWVNVVHWDWFNPSLMDAWRGAVLVAPNKMCQKELKENYNLESRYLPVPIDTERFVFRRRERAERFISVYGHGGAYDRRSLPELFLSWSDISEPPPLTIFAQTTPPELERYMPPAQVTVRVTNLPEPEDLYERGDVAVQISRYEGIGLAFLEAMARGLPVITTKAPPMDEVAPEFTVAVEETVKVDLAGKKILSFIPSVSGIRELVEYLKGRDISEISEQVRARVEKQYSWKALRQEWLKLLG